MPRRSCRCECGCTKTPAKGNRYKCAGTCNRAVCLRCTICGVCQKTWTQCLCHAFKTGVPAICHQCYQGDDLTGAMGDWDTFFRACSLRIHHFGSLLPWAQRAIDRLEYGRTEVRPFLEDCITMGPAGDGTIAWPINLSHNFAVPGREKEYTAITKIAAWFESTDTMPKLRQIFQSQMAGPKERDSSTPYASTIWERIATTIDTWTTFLAACGR